MRKKFLGVLLLAMSAVICTLLSACGNHAHTFSTKWSCDEQSHWHQSDCGHEEETASKAEHLWGINVIKPVSHTQDGEELHTCKVCGYQKTIIVPMSEDAHTFSDEWSVDATAHWKKAVCEHENEIANRAEHVGSWSVLIEPDCTSDGLKTFVCDVCNFTKEEVIQATGHKSDTEWTFNESHHWHKSVCKHSDLKFDEQQHNFVNDICSDCGYYKGPYIKYELSESNNSYTVVGVGTFTGKALVIPAEYKGLPVTAIADSAFFCSTVEEIVLPYGVTKIGDNAFYGCQLLKKVYLPDTVDYIGSNAFYNCRALQSINIPFKIKEISNGAFYKCDSLTNVVLIGSNVTKIGNAAFAWCSSLSAINIPYSVNSIGESAFSECTALTDIELPDSVRTIGDGAFFNCKALTHAILPKGLTQISKNLFNYCNSLVSVVIPEGVTVVNDFAFSECRSLHEVDFPESINKLGEAAFANCSALKVVKVNGNIAEVGNYAFDNCNQIDTVYMPSQSRVFDFISKDMVTTVVVISGQSISSTQFKGCTALKNLTIPDSVTSIGSSAFDDCVSISHVTMPCSAIGYILKTNLRNVTLTSGTSIDSYTFENCYYLQTITLPAELDSIGYYSFYGCNNLTTINYEGDITSWCAINGLGNIMTSGRTLYIGGNAVSGEIVIPNGVTSIGDYAFAYCNRATNITIPDSITSIGYYSFYGCNNLTTINYEGDIASWCAINGLENIMTSGRTLYIGGNTVSGEIVIPNGVTSISDYAFAYCDNLSSIYIPDSVTSIGSSAFYNCVSVNHVTMPCSAISYVPKANLRNVTLTSGTSIDSYAFENCYYLETVTLPAELTSISYYAFNGCNSLTTINYEGDIASWCAINGLENIMTSGRTLYIGGNTVSGEIVIPNGVTSISDYAFAYCDNLSSIYIPDSVTSIGSSAFYNCVSVNRVTMPCSAISYVPKANLRNVTLTSGTSIDSYAFENCYYLETVTLPAELTSISYYAFNGCNSLTTINYEGDIASWCAIDGLENIMASGRTLYIGGNTVSGELVIPNGVTSIGDYTFAYCDNLSSVTIPDSVTTINYGAFNRCTNLTTINYEGDIASWCAIDGLGNIMASGRTLYIGGNAVSGELVIPDGVTSIGDYTFAYCDNLSSINIPDSVTSIGYGAFYGCNNLAAINYEGDIASWCAIDGLGNIMASGRTLYIGGNAVSGELVIPDGVTSISNYAFAYCDNLSSVTIPDSVTSISDYAFSSCYNLQAVYFEGTSDLWNNISIGYGNSSLISATRYYYSEVQPELSGSFWHYVEGVPTVW